MGDQFEIQPLVYDSRDFAAIRDDALARIDKYITEWTNRNPSDPGIVILELFAGMHDVLHFYIDRCTREQYMSDALGRRSMVALSALVGANLKGKAPAAVLLDFTLQQVQGVPVIIPAGTRCATVGINPTVFFETVEAVTIDAGNTVITGVLARQGETKSASIGTGNGEPYQIFLIANNDSVLDEGISLEVASVAWDFIGALIEAGPDDQVWTFHRDERGRVDIATGNGTAVGGNGLIIPDGADVTATWREGGGRGTNVGVGTIKTVTDTIFAGPLPVAISCNNPARAQGGDEQESVELARRRIPRLHRANDRGVVSQDYEALAETIPGVLKAYARVDGVARWLVYILPHPSVGVGSGVDPFGYTILGSVAQSQQALAQLVQTQLLEKVMETDGLEVRLVNFRPIDSAFSLVLRKGANRLKVENDLSRFFGTFFDPAELSIGRQNRRIGDIQISDWIGGLEGISGVDFVDLSTFQLRPLVETVQSLGDEIINTVNYTQFTIDARWEVVFLDPAIYKVYRQDIDGGAKIPQTELGVLDQTFISDNREVEILIASPAGEAPHGGDKFRFRTGPVKGTTRIEEGEVAAQGNLSYTLIGGA